MSLHKTARIDCDHTGCPAHVGGVNGTAARNNARAQGWLCRNTTDLCPTHRPQTREARIALPASDITGWEGT